jgi:hypothetical protein
MWRGTLLVHPGTCSDDFVAQSPALVHILLLAKQQAPPRRQACGQQHLSALEQLSREASIDISNQPTAFFLVHNSEIASYVGLLI